MSAENPTSSRPAEMDRSVMRTATRYSEGDDYVEGESEYDPCCMGCVSGLNPWHRHGAKSVGPS